MVFVDPHDTKSGRFVNGHFNGCHGEVCLIFQMIADQGGVIHAVNVVTGEDQDQVGIRLFDEAEILLHSVGCASKPACVPGFVRGINANAPVNRDSGPMAHQNRDAQ